MKIEKNHERQHQQPKMSSIKLNATLKRWKLMTHPRRSNCGLLQRRGKTNEKGICASNRFIKLLHQCDNSLASFSVTSFFFPFLCGSPSVWHSCDSLCVCVVLIQVRWERSQVTHWSSHSKFDLIYGRFLCILIKMTRMIENESAREIRKKGKKNTVEMPRIFFPQPWRVNGFQEYWIFLAAIE